MTTITDKLAEALRDAARSLETIGRLAGKPYYGRDEQGEPIPTYMGHNDEVRSYANNRAGVAIAALAAFDAQQSAEFGFAPLTEISACPHCGGPIDQQSAPSEPVQGEREAFEAWLNPGNHADNVSPWVEPGRYEKDTHSLAWLAWQARAAIAAFGSGRQV